MEDEYRESQLGNEAEALANQCKCDEIPKIGKVNIMHIRNQILAYLNEIQNYSELNEANRDLLEFHLKRWFIALETDEDMASDRMFDDKYLTEKMIKWKIFSN